MAMEIDTIVRIRVRSARKGSSTSAKDRAAAMSRAEYVVRTKLNSAFGKDGGYTIEAIDNVVDMALGDVEPLD